MKIGILGSGMIVTSALQSISKLDNVECTALWCRGIDMKPANELVDKYGIKNLFTNLDDFLADDSYDVVYVGLINSLHYEYSKKALEAGKHVICEKPFTSTFNEARELLAIAKEKELFLFEAIMLRYVDNYDELGRQLKQIEPITMVQCNYSQYSSRFDRYLDGVVLPAFDPHLSGGALYDINVYCIHFTMGLFGKPEKLNYLANIGVNGIDTSGVLVMDYGSFKAICVGAKDSNSPAKCVIQGQNGFINMDSMPAQVKNVNLCLNGQDSQVIDIKELDEPMVNEFAKIDAIIENNDYAKCYEYMDKTLAVMDVLEQARKDARIRFDADEKLD